ncbi:MAG: amidohydrolase family protein, partial [Myxococcota bacterium]
IQMMDIVMSGILPRNPGLRIASVESGIGWIPFVKEAMDHGFTYTDVRGERPEFERMPSEYMREQIWACSFFEEYAPSHMLDAIGADRVMFETDYPHPICLYGNVREKIDAAWGDHPPDVQHQVLFRNAAELYRVPDPDRAWKPQR